MQHLRHRGPKRAKLIRITVLVSVLCACYFGWSLREVAKPRSRLVTEDEHRTERVSGEEHQSDHANQNSDLVQNDSEGDGEQQLDPRMEPLIRECSPDVSLEEWMKTTFDAEFSKLEIFDFPIGGGATVRGLRAAADIAENEQVFSAPTGAQFTRTAANNSQLKPFLDELQSVQLDDQESICLLLLFEIVHVDKSPWKPWLCSLPRDLSFMPTFWTENKLKSNDPPLLDSVTTQIDIIKRAYQNIFPTLFRNFPGSFTSADFSFSRFLWVWILVRSRNWAIEDKDGDYMALMVPFIDMLNHKDDGKFLSLHPGPDGITMTSVSNVTKGEELLYHYGQHCNRDFLFYYGFELTDNQIPC